MAPRNPLLSMPLSRANEAALRSFERSLRARRVSANTIQSYLEAARLLAGFLATGEEELDLEEAGRAGVERFMIDQLEQWTPTTAAVRFRSLQAFYKWALEEELIEVNPTVGLKAPKPDTVPVPVVPDDSIKKLLDTCAGKDLIQRRDTAIVRLFIDTGVRCAEMVGLDVTDVDMKYDEISVMGKGQKRRVVPFGSKTGQALERYLRVRARSAQGERPWLWVGGKGVRLTDSGVRQMLERRGLEAGIGHVHPHQFRHTAAHYAAGQDMSEGDMMRLFGWSSSEMPKRYGSSAADERARAAARRLAAGDRF